MCRTERVPTDGTLQAAAIQPVLHPRMFISSGSAPDSEKTGMFHPSIEEEDFEEATREAAPSTASGRKPGPPEPQSSVAEIPEAVDDFLRNFLRRAGLSRTLNRFEAEWYGSAQKLLTETLPVAAAGFSFVPDALTHGQLLRSELETVRRDTDRLRQEVLVAGEALVRMQRERDFHRLQYRRVAGDKNRLIEDFKELKKHLQSYEPALRQLEDKYQAALRHKMLISLKKDRLQNTTDARQNQEKSQTTKEKSPPLKYDVPPPQSNGLECCQSDKFDFHWVRVLSLCCLFCQSLTFHLVNGYINTLNTHCMATVYFVEI
uniref:Uncharacterized protein n=1 Tax=Sander lucioperca TaxID=283035 RepID=A0A8C9ZNS9_SANLU